MQVQDRAEAKEVEMSQGEKITLSALLYSKSRIGCSTFFPSNFLARVKSTLVVL